jgi:hypothetical protein
MRRLLALLVSLVAASSANTSKSVCANKARLPSYAKRHGHAPAKSDLGFCTRYSSRTCCSRDHGRLAQTSVWHLTSGETPSSVGCGDAWARLQCALCHPRLGVSTQASVCTTFCESTLAACEDEFFALDVHTQLVRSGDDASFRQLTRGPWRASTQLTPCRDKDTVCARLREWAASGGEFCSLAGYLPAAPEDGWCYDGEKHNEVEKRTAGSGKSGGRSNRARCVR